MDVKVDIHFSNGDKITLDKKSIIFPWGLYEDKGEKILSKSKAFSLEDVFHHNYGYVADLMSIFALNEFFSVDAEGPSKTKYYKTSSIVSIEQFGY